MEILARLDETRSQTNVLEHPFYQRWSAGELSAGELERYAGEYRHAVLALAAASELAADSADGPHAAGLRRHAAEETAHVALWDQFAAAAAAPAAATAPAGHTPPAAHAAACLTETAECVAAWTAGDDTLEHLAVLYAIEAGQPDISRTKLDGLTAHYGYAAEGPASEYFAVHELRDVEHAHEAGELIVELLAASEDPAGQAERMVQRAERALRGNWRLLDGVEAAAAAA